MPHWIDIVSDAAWRERLGRRFEALTDEVFHVVRWATIVGFVRFLEVTYPALAFTVTRWALTVFLFGYVASRFLLRPEIRFVPKTAPRWLRVVQFLLNFLVCFVVFGLVLWGLQQLVSTVVDYRTLR